MPARRRRELIAQHRRGKARTLRLVVPFKKKRNADSAVTRKKARITAGDLVSSGKIPDTFSASLAGETSRYIAQIELQNKGARTVQRDVGGAYFHGKQPDIEKPSGRAISAPIPPGWAELCAKHGLCFDERRRGELMILQIVGNLPGLQNAGVIWAEEFTSFLLGFGFKQSNVDRRLF